MIINGKSVINFTRARNVNLNNGYGSQNATGFDILHYIGIEALLARIEECLKYELSLNETLYSWKEI